MSGPTIGFEEYRPALWSAIFFVERTAASTLAELAGSNLIFPDFTVQR